MKRWIFGYILPGGIHAALENKAEFRNDRPGGIGATHMIRALCDGEWHRYDYANHAGVDSMPEHFPPGVICPACAERHISSALADLSQATADGIPTQFM